MEIKIYQINKDRDINMAKFLQYNDKPIDSKIYDMVYAAETDCKDLEGIFREFNTECPEDFKGHSLSVSDIIEVLESDTLKKGFYFCDRFGFKEVSFDSSLCQIAFKENNKITVLIVEPGESPVLVDIDTSLKSMQSIVHGYIQEIMPFDDEVALVCNEEGKVNGLPLNRAIYNKDGEMIDIIAGKFFICSAPFESENFESLSKEQQEKYAKVFKNPETFYRNSDGKIIVNRRN